MPRSVSRPVVALVLGGVALVVAGTLWFAAIGDASFGWFAYAPTSGAVFQDGAVLLTPQHRLALVTCILGALLLSATAGYVVGRRRRS